MTATAAGKNAAATAKGMVAGTIKLPPDDAGPAFDSSTTSGLRHLARRSDPPNRVAAAVRSRILKGSL
jgi:hypothetical protein